LTHTHTQRNTTPTPQQQTTQHHRAYVDNLNKQIAGTALEAATLEAIVLESWNKGSPTPAFNNAAQVWNHTFFWESMKPNGGGAPTGKLADAISASFGSLDEFKAQFKAAGATQFGSGWAWLVADKAGKLSIEKTPNAVTPVVEGKTPILTMDVRLFPQCCFLGCRCFRRRARSSSLAAALWVVGRVCGGDSGGAALRRRLA
jgi:superoxide dismutase